MNIVDFFKNLLNSLVGTSLERMKLINTMNQTFKDSYCSGALDRFCKVSITVGDTNYAHEMSAFFLRSGFRISIENDNNLRESEIREISQYILSNKPFIRQLMTLGFDTLLVGGKHSKKEIQYSLKSYTQLGGFSLE